ncbi:unnamed protein product [Microthlaspi erraticum]|uniref:Uncharacterized protein n=1 Tax=Microthlaspi erraticum TaxID=1685480 RepID=A0A6D2J0N9_9BRAS|nr:unnamed protein product [Microthlaspi erraticum]
MERTICTGHGKPTIVLEAVASYDLWIWHAFFGPPGTLNDINVLHRSPVFDDILEGRAPKVSFSVNGHRYKMAYYLTDGIYPEWSTFVKPIPQPGEPKAKLFCAINRLPAKKLSALLESYKLDLQLLKTRLLPWIRRR